MRLLALLLVVLLSACANVSPEKRRTHAETLAATRGWQPFSLPTQDFVLMAYGPVLSVISASNQAVDALKQRYGAQEIVLVGYSGGGAVAALVAARRTDVVRLVTVAGNLDHLAWTHLHSVPPPDRLSQSSRRLGRAAKHTATALCGSARYEHHHGSSLIVCGPLPPGTSPHNASRARLRSRLLLGPAMAHACHASIPINGNNLPLLCGESMFITQVFTENTDSSA
jgi:hypothetical protein